MHRKFFFPLAALLAALTILVAPSLHAQVVGGSIHGTISDSSGSAVQGANVTVLNEETGNVRHIVTDASGRYSAPSIPVGSYAVTVEKTGFANAKRSQISLVIGQSIAVDLTLGINEVVEQVNVVDEPQTVNVATQQTSGLVNERQVKELPLNGRSYDQLLTLNPATVNYTAQRSGTIGTSNSSVGSMFAIDGRRPQDNLYLLNGVEYTGASLINVTPGGTSGQLLGVDAVREFNVVADTYGANYGKRQGAQISIVTNSGTNSIHGSAYEFLRNSFFDARNYFDQSRIPEFQRNNYGASLGGPIKRDKLFLFGNYEGYRQNLGLSDVTYVPDATSRAAAAASVKPYLNLWPVANGPELLLNGANTGIALAYSSPMQHIKESFGTTRFDYNVSANDLLFGVYTIDDSTASTPTANPYAGIDESLREQVLSLQEQHVFSSHLLNTARFGFSRASFYFIGTIPADIQAVTPSFVPGKPTGAIVIAGSTASNGASQITGAGANVGSNNAIARNLFTFDDHVFYTKGKHQIEVGGWLQRLQSNDNLAQNQYGQASFASLSTFLAGTIKTYTVVPNPTPLGWRVWLGAGYIDDVVHLTSRLELRGGIRFESTNGWNESQGRAAYYQFTNGVINTNPTVGASALTENRAKFLPEPRFGFAWNVFGNGTTAVTGGIGLHHSLLDNLDYRLDQAAPFNTTYSYSGTTIAAPTTSSAGPGLISPSNVQTDIETPGVLTFTVKVEQQLAKNTSLTIGYIGSHAYHQILSEDQNEPAFVICPASNCPATIAAGTIYYPTTVKANPAVANTTSWVSQGIANYNALTVDLRRQYANGLQLRANYTFAKNLDNGSAWNTSVSANTPAFVSFPANPHLDYGPAATDIRNIFALNATYDLPFGQKRHFLGNVSHAVNYALGGWSLSSIVNLQTGFPFSPQLGYNPTGSGDSRNPVRPDVNPAFTGNVYTKGSTAQRVAQFFKPAAFKAPAYGTVGNLGRDTLTGPGYADWDLSLTKRTQLTQGVGLQFRAEFFNILNHTNLQIPSALIYSSGPTQGNTTAQNTAAVASPTAGNISSAATSRQIQLGLKLVF